MKNIFILILISFSLLSRSQSINTISDADFEQIKINNVTLKQIREADRKLSVLNPLLGEPVSTDIQDATDYDFSAVYYYNGFQLAFASTVIAAEGMFSAFEINGSQATLTIKDIDIKIGDDIGKLGRVQKNDQRDGGKSVLYQSAEDDTAVLSIRYNPSTMKVIEIIYYVMT